MLVLDFETRSKCDLLTAGAYEYAADPSTDIICLAACDTETGGEWLWYPHNGDFKECCPTLILAIEKADFLVAHYAEFDMLIYECVGVPDYGFPEVPLKKWYCSSAQCRVNALPAKLDDAARALELSTRKDYRGAYLIKQLSIPNEKGYFNTDPALTKEMGEYCMQDVRVVCEILKKTRVMTQFEHQDWLVTCEINERGVRIDRPLATTALEYAAAEQAEIATELIQLTDGTITKHTQHQRAKDYMLNIAAAQKEPLIIEQMTVYKKGEKKYSLDKNVRNNLLNMADDGVLDLDDVTYSILCCLDDGNKSSVSKFKRMVQMASREDDRVRGAFVYAGASQTLRYSSSGLQLHNMRRDCWGVKDAETFRGMMLAGQTYIATGGVSVMDMLSRLLRPTLIPAEGNIFVVGDWSGIEAMVLPWLSNSNDGERQLEIFRSGKDIYRETADSMGMDDRQTGKVAVLSLGFMGGVGAFQSMARNYQVIISDAEAQVIVDNWRRANPWATNYWSLLNNVAREAIRHPAVWHMAGRVCYMYVPELIDGTLLCKLPGDNLIQYPRCRLEDVTDKWGRTRLSITALKASYKPTADAKEWPRAVLWPGLLAENITQAFAAVLLRDALRVTRKTVAHVHDEIIMEVDLCDKEDAIIDLKYTMENPLPYAGGLPLKADPVTMVRYGK